MTGEREQHTLSVVLVRAGTVALVAVLIAGGSAAIGLTAVGWAAPLVVIVISVSLIWYLLERAERRRRSDLRELARRAQELGAPRLPVDDRPVPSSLADALARLDERAQELQDELESLARDARSGGDMLGAIDEPVVATDARGTVMLCNEAALPVLATGGESAEGQRLEDLIAQPELLRLHADAIAGQHGRARVRVVVAGATRWYDVSAAALPGASGGEAGALLCLRDVTELATAVQLKTDFAANASHELRTPIASIRAAIETMSRAGSGDEAMNRRLREMIGTNITRLEELVSDLLDLSRLESVELETRDERLDLCNLLGALAPTFDAVCAGRDLRIDADFEEGASVIECDPKLVELIVRNLIENATKFAFEGTPIVVRSRRLGAPGKGAGITLSVIDRGIGIPLAHQQRVFERFYQVDEARQGGSEKRGTGLGLAIVKHAARRLGGNVRVESVWQEGTSMHVDLPGVLASPSAT